jgi:hypothetical protein
MVLGATYIPQGIQEDVLVLAVQVLVSESEEEVIVSLVSSAKQILRRKEA